MRGIGYGDFSGEKLFAMALHGVSLAYLHDLRRLGLLEASAESTNLSARVHDITTDYIRDLRCSGTIFPRAILSDCASMA
jgi:hypothetical protein